MWKTQMHKGCLRYAKYVNCIGAQSFKNELCNEQCQKGKRLVTGT